MLLYVRGEVVVAMHDDAQAVAPSTYGDGIVVVPFAGELAERIGPAPSGGRTDQRPFRLPALAPADLKGIAAHYRWMAESRGITVAGIHVATDDRAKTLIAGAAASLADGATVKFKTPSGFVDVTGASLRAIRDAVVAHVQACFAAEADVVAAIDAGILTTPTQVALSDWP